MNILNTKIGKIFITDWADLLVGNMLEMERKNKEKQRKYLIKKKKVIGLTEEERLAPCDSFCNHDYIENIEILKREPFYTEEGQMGTIIHQKVTYIDGSVKIFDIRMTLSSLPVPEGYEEYVNKKKSLNRF